MSAGARWLGILAESLIVLLSFAIAVLVRFRGDVGWALLDGWLAAKAVRCVRRVISIESRDNHAAIELEREKGFVPEPFDGDPTLVVLSKTFR